MLKLYSSVLHISINLILLSQMKKGKFNYCGNRRSRASSIRYPRFNSLEKNSTPCDEVTTTFKEACMYMYTSGTTGLPKAALITNERAVRMTYFGQFLGFNFKQSDVLYNTLPLYHAMVFLLLGSFFKSWQCYCD